MNDQFRKILEDLPKARPRSRLEPYQELIWELRDQRRPYREIAQLLADRCGVRVSHSTLHEFVHRHFQDRTEPSARVSEEAKTDPVNVSRSVAQQEITKRIDALKRKQPNRPNDSTGFQFDDSEPLRLKPGKT